ncbi:reverse transcriptase domain-containing protein [Tanacetum coccineum]|uniref:Reverse transcriptase domain-containing protein n=1 Tax=Tanacetum coccineum TaxID=301880 RepID=A0ABQ4WMV7_9ASTR
MADNRTMAQMLQAPIEGYEDAIVVPPINANNFELKQPLINLVQSNKFTGRQDPHNHLRFFNKVTSTFRHPEVPNTSIKLLLFPFSLDGEARDWLDKEPPRSILTWDDLVSKFINQYFPPSKTTYYRNEIITFYQKPNEAFNEAWERFKGLLRQYASLEAKDDYQDEPNDESNESFSYYSCTSQSNFENYVKANDAVLKNVQNQASTSSSGTLSKSNRKTNLCQQINAITTRSVREHDKPSAQYSRFLKMFKQLRLEIGLKDALVEMPKFNKWLSSLLRNKEKLEEIAITTVNAECSAIIMNKVPEKLEDPGKFLIPCALQELKRTSALADSGASINLLPYSIYKKLELEALTPTRMTLELANRSISHPMGIAEDVVVRVDGFTFLADFVVVNFEPDPRVPIILGRPFLRTAKALIDLYEEKLTLNGSTTTHSDDPSPSSSPVKTSDNFVKFADELAPLNSLPPGNDDSTLKKDLHEENFQEDVEIKNSNVSDKLVFLNTPLSDKDECFAPEDDNDEIDDFLAIEVSSNLEEGYFDSEGDIAFLDNLLSDDDSHNLDSKVTSDHEPEQNESSITFSPRSNPFHHEFAGEPLTLPARNDREFEEYLSLMTVLNEISTSQGNFHQNSVIESLPMSPILVEDSEPTQEEIDILLVPDNLIPPGVEDADSEDELNESTTLITKMSVNSRLPPEPPGY